ncbi:MAG: phytanoyl-CoA dioxygenase family protein [Bryobacter sp.]|nr:phytanoyl-CoA dioxygenase family protein [Bryobacter sp.]
MNLRYTLHNHGFEILRGFTWNESWEEISRQEELPSEDWRQDWANAEAGNLVLWLALGTVNFSNGGLKVCPTSHKHGVLTPAHTRAHAARPFAAPGLEAGDAVLMHPLTIHAKAPGEGARLVKVVLKDTGLYS